MKSNSFDLKMLSGFAPPLSYSIYGKKDIKDKSLEANVINDYDKALQMAKEQNKLLLIDFTGWACVNCRKMEEHVWTLPDIKQLIKDKYILVSLYVDDRQKLPADKQFVFTATDSSTKEIRTVGNKWATFQAENFKQVTQPLYVVLSPDGKLITNPIGYTSDAETYKEWLNCGVRTYRDNK